MIGCPSCGQENPDGFRLCGMCGASLAATAAPAREERKVVSVLFCDLVGFTAKAEAMDPEDVEALLRPYHERVRSELERHGGTVEKFIGDAVMALFGAPTAHEDDPERAVRAALAIREFAEKEGLELRVGITTGEALVRLDVDPRAGEGMASGDVVNTAARLQSAAPVNGVVVDEMTYRATRHVVDYEDAEPVEAKGKSEPLPVWQATGSRARFGVDVAHEARSELVGRERELGVLRDAFERARHERVPQLVTLVGVPGIGKSRLVYELRQIADADPDIITWRQGRCLAYGDGITFWALGEIVKAQAGVSERDTEVEATRKLHSAVEDVLAGSADARWVESHLRPLIGLEVDDGFRDDRRAEAFAAWRRFLEAMSEQRSLVLVFEDLHWADENLLDFLDELVGWLADAPLMVVGTARPELLERRPGWGGGKLNALTLGLSPLSPEQTARLLSHVLDRSVLPAEVQRGLLERAEGNPLYAEQFARLYVERGVANELPLPETLQGILAARLDGLSTEEKALLQDASVLGKVFWTGALRRPEADALELLRSLQHKGFVQRQPRSSVELETEWAFAHTLLRDVAYGQIPRADRASKHRDAAAWIASLGRPEDHAELVAYHWRAALELARAAALDVGELVEPTRVALRQAGDRAFTVNAYPAAAAYYADALALWPAEDEGRPQLLYRYAEALHIAEDESAADALGAAREALLAGGNRQVAALVELALRQLYLRRGEAKQGSEALTRAAELAGAGPSRAAARVLLSEARLSPDPRAWLLRAEKALALAEELGSDELRARSLAEIAAAKAELRDPSSDADYERALEIALDLDARLAAAILGSMTVSAFMRLDFGRSIELLAETGRIADRVGDAALLRWARYQQTTAAFVAGDWDFALRLAESFIAECETQAHFLEPDLREYRGHIREGRGDVEGALSDFRLALVSSRDREDPMAILRCIGPLVLAFETHPAPEEAKELATEMVELTRTHPQEAVWVLPFHFLLSRVALEFEGALRAALEDAQLPHWRELALACLDQDFVRAADIWAVSGHRSMEARTRLRAGEKLVGAGQRAEAQGQLDRALDFYRSVGATLFVERGERLLAEARTA